MAKSLLKTGKKKKPQRRKVKGLVAAPTFLEGETIDTGFKSGGYYYHTELNSKDWAKRVAAYLKSHRKTDWKHIKKLPSWKYSFSHWAFYSDAIMAGALLPDNTSEWFDGKIKELVEEGEFIKPTKEEVVKKKAYVPSIQEKMREKRSDLIGEMESWEDEGVWDTDVFKWLKEKNVAQQHLKHMMVFFAPKLEEMELLQKGDKEVAEGYDLSKAAVKRYIALYKRILKDLEAYEGTKKATRGKRTKKQPSKEKLVAKINYKKEDHDFKVASVCPTEIIGATQLWFFDTVRRQLGVYHASSTAGTLGVRGAGIVGYDEAISKQKTLRKPGEVLPLVLKGTKPKLKKLLGSLNTTEKNVKSRLNKNMIILRIV